MLTVLTQSSKGGKKPRSKFIAAEPPFGRKRSTQAQRCFAVAWPKAAPIKFNRCPRLRILGSLLGAINPRLSAPAVLALPFSLYFRSFGSFPSPTVRANAMLARLPNGMADRA
jgi:hypothetical protein